MINEKNCTYLYVGNVTTGIGDGAAVDIDTMPAGSTAFTYYNSGVLARESALDDATEYEIVSKLSDGTIVRSPRFLGSDVVSHGYAAYSQPSQQVSFLGYDGTTINGFGTITVGDSYSVALDLTYTAGEYAQQAEIKHISAYATDDEEATVAKNLFESHRKNFGPLRQKYPSILCDRIARTDSVAAIDAVTDILKFTKGSKTVSISTKTQGTDAAAFTAGTGTIAAGEEINVPSYNGRTFTFDAIASETHSINVGTESIYVTSADANTTTQAAAIVTAINAATTGIGSVCSASNTDEEVTITYRENFYGLPPVVIRDANNTPLTVAVTIATGDAVPVMYTCPTAITSAATFELDQPWQGETGYVYSGTTAATHAGAATLNAADAWGLKFTGVMQPYDPVAGRWDVVEFNVLGGTFGASGTEYKAVAPNKGHGNWRDIAELEQYAQGNETFYRNSNYPHTPNRKEAVAGTGGLGYDVATVNVKSAGVTWAATGVNVASPWTAVITRRNGITAPAIQTIFA